MTCSVEGCERPTSTRDLCSLHYQRWRRNPERADLQQCLTTGYIPAEERFWSKVDKSGDCWEWKAGGFPSGYGAFWLNGRQVHANRAAWILTNGPIPEGAHVLHRCDNPPCVRPDHLWLGSHAENMADRSAKGRGRVPKTSGPDELLATVAECERRRLELLGELKANGERHGAAVAALVAAVGQGEAAQRLGVSRQQVWRLARGR